jgi:hypothetical protein
MTWVGLGEIVWLNLSMALMALAALGLVYLALAEFKGARAALPIMAIVALSHAMHQGAIMLLSDVPYMLLMWTGLYCYYRSLRSPGWWMEAGSVALVIGCGIRAPGCAVLLAAAVGLAIQPRTAGRLRARLNALAIVLTLCGGFIAVKAIHQARTHGMELPSYSKGLVKVAGLSPAGVAERVAENALDTGDYLCHLLTGQPLQPWIALVVIWPPILLGMLAAARRGELLGVAIVGGYLLMIMPLAPVISRYSLPIMPLVALYFVEGIRWLVERRAAWQKHVPRVAIACAVVLVALNLPKVVRGVYWQHVPSAARDYRERRLCWQTAKKLRLMARPGDRFVSDKEQRKLAYWSGLPSLPLSDRYLKNNQLTLHQFDNWQQQGVRLIVQSDEANPGQRRELRDLCKQHGYRRAFDNGAYRIFVAPPDRVPVPQWQAGKTKAPKSTKNKTHRSAEIARSG